MTLIDYGMDITHETSYRASTSTSPSPITKRVTKVVCEIAQLCKKHVVQSLVNRKKKSFNKPIFSRK